MKEFCSAFAKVTAGLLSLLATSAMAEKVTPLMAQDLAGLAGKEGLMLTVEYEGGTVLITPLELGAVLVMLTGTSVNLGRVRLAARRFHSQYLQHAAVAA